MKARQKMKTPERQPCQELVDEFYSEDKEVKASENKKRK